MRHAIAIFIVLAGVGWSIGAPAQVYRCTAANGAVSYQDRACARGLTQRVIDMPSHPAPGDQPPPLAASPPPAATVATAPGAMLVPPSPPPPAALPPLYACVGEVNGKHYLSRVPTAPYLAPLGAMGYPPMTLSQAYGDPGGAGMSAPELSRAPIRGPSIAAGMSEVQDYCAPAPKVEVCQYVEREYAKNHRALRMAMRSESPPLQQREQHLRDQLRNCN